MVIRDNIISKITIYRLDVPLIKPYKLSYNTFYSFEPLLIHIVDDQGNEGWGEQHISPGSSSETRDGGWTFARVISKLILNKKLYEAKEIILSNSSISIVASSAIYTAIEMLEKNNILNNKSSLKLKLLTSFNAEEESEIKDELDKVTEQGFTTIKIKVGKDVNADIKKINNFSWAYDDYTGSSLKSINEVLVKKGYTLIATNITGSNAFFVSNDLVIKCKTKGQTLNQLYSPSNYELFNYNVAHAPTNKYLIDKLNAKKNINSN